MKYRPVLMLGIMVALAAGTFYLYSPKSQVITTPDKPTTENNIVSDREMVQITIGDTTLEVEAVTSPASITQGLSGRSEIGSDGMLFVMPDRRVVSFWMPDMQFDLDMIWIDGDTVAGITGNVPKPAPGQSRDELQSYSSIVPVTHVLEIPAGTASELGLHTGDSVQIQK